MNEKAYGTILEIIKKSDKNQIVSAYFIDKKSFSKLVDISGRPDVPPSISLKSELAESEISALQKLTKPIIPQIEKVVKSKISPGKVAEAEYLKIEEETFALAKKLKSKGLINYLIPQQKNIRLHLKK